MRVRANAGSGSFRRDTSLEEAQKAAETLVQEIRRQHDQESDGGELRRKAALEHAARARLERIDAARTNLKVMVTFQPTEVLQRNTFAGSLD
jgi:DNA-binding TFAR19-related protein (PDSD5 family)